jgi:VWFA-related protein
MAALLAFTAGASDLRSQTPSPTLTVNARLVALDVVVTDKAGRPVEGLKPSDFKVFEDDKLQPIRSVESSSAHNLPPDTASQGATASFDPANPITFGNSPVVVLVLDQSNTHFSDSSFARTQLRDYLGKQPQVLAQPTTLLDVYDDHFKQLQGFTRDRDALLKALAAAPTQYAWQLEINGKTGYGPLERLDQSLRALEQVSQSYARIAGRKNLVWIGGGFPTVNPKSLGADQAQEVKDTLDHVTNVLLNTRVTLYAIDPTSSAAGLTEITDPDQANFADAAGDTLAGGIDPFDAAEDFDKLGPVTGGRVVRGLNDVAQQIASAVDLGAHYYTLTYAPTSTSDRSLQYRKIRVVCLRPGVAVATRSGYYAGQTAQDKSASAAAYDLTTAAEGSMPLNGLRVSVVPAPAPNDAPGNFVVKVRAADLTWKLRADGGSDASVYIMAVALNGKQKMLSHTLHPMTAVANPGTDLQAPSRNADFLFTVPSTPHTVSLRFIVRDSDNGRMGSVETTIGKP